MRENGGLNCSTSFCLLKICTVHFRTDNLSLHCAMSCTANFTRRGHHLPYCNCRLISFVQFSEDKIYLRSSTGLAQQNRTLSLSYPDWLWLTANLFLWNCTSVSPQKRIEPFRRLNNIFWAQNITEPLAELFSDCGEMWKDWSNRKAKYLFRNIFMPGFTTCGNVTRTGPITPEGMTHWVNICRPFSLSDICASQA